MIEGKEFWFSNITEVDAAYKSYLEFCRAIKVPKNKLVDKAAFVTVMCKTIPDCEQVVIDGVAYVKGPIVTANPADRKPAITRVYECLYEYGVRPETTDPAKLMHQLKDLEIPLRKRGVLVEGLDEVLATCKTPQSTGTKLH